MQNIKHKFHSSLKSIANLFQDPFSFSFDKVKKFVGTEALCVKNPVNILVQNCGFTFDIHHGAAGWYQKMNFQGNVTETAIILSDQSFLDCDTMCLMK